MSIFNFSNRKAVCQKGFLMLEALIALAALTLFIMGIAQWYVQTVTAHHVIQKRLRIVIQTTCCMSFLQSSCEVPSVIQHETPDCTMRVSMQQDAQVTSFYWVKITATSRTPPTVVYELCSGVAT